MRAARLASALALAALAAGTLSACRGSDPQRLEALSVDPLGGAGSLVAGGGAEARLAYTAADSIGNPRLRLLGLDPAAPGGASQEGEVILPGGGTITRLRVDGGVAALLLDGEPWLVDLADPALPVGKLAAPAGVLELAVRGRWVALGLQDRLALVDREVPAVAVEHPLAGPVAAIVTTAWGFFAFAGGGGVAVDLTGGAPAFQDVAAPSLAGVRAAAPSADGRAAMAAGDGPAPGHAVVLRLDLAVPSAPTVVARRELPGAFAAFAWDGEDLSVLAVHGEADGAAPGAFHQGWLVREGAGGFEAEGVPLAFWSDSAQPLAARAGHLLAARADGVALLRIR